MTRYIKASFFTLALLGSLLVPFIRPATTHATPSATSPTRCGDNSWLLDDDWVTATAKHPVTIQPAGVKGLMDVIWPHHVSQPSQFSFIIGQTPAISGRGFQIYVMDNTDASHWELVKDSTGYYATTVNNAGNYAPTSYNWSYINDNNWDGTKDPTGKAWPYIGTSSPFFVSPSTQPSINFTCIVSVTNVTYGPGWDGPVYSTKLLYGTSTIQCDKLDLGCWVNKAWTGVADTFTSVGKALLSGIASIFAPDGTQLQSDFNAFNSFMTAKLGFLLYPFQFLVNLFNAFNSSSSWCTASSCTKNFGNLFGHPFTLDLNAMATVMPTMWSWFLGLIRGTTVLALVLALRRKYMSVVGK
jgi:hypothetical protein